MSRKRKVEFFDLYIRAEDGKITNVTLADGNTYRFEVELSDTVKRKLYRAIEEAPPSTSKREISKERNIL